ncbi:MAG: hypothetical protein JWQ69_46 [Pseudomonas sp.]|nr:hypothetical protein [Pseudomonas sp.]
MNLKADIYIVKLSDLFVRAAEGCDRPGTGRFVETFSQPSAAPTRDQRGLNHRHPFQLDHFRALQ